MKHFLNTFYEATKCESSYYSLKTDLELQLAEFNHSKLKCRLPLTTRQATLNPILISK